jgi:hypothetical protein
MKLKIDGNEIADMKEIDACKTLDEAFQPLKKIADKRNRIISRVTVDNIILSSDSENTFRDKPLKDIGLLEVETDSAEELAKVTFDNSLRFLDSFKQQVDKFIEVLQNGGEENAYEVFVDDLKGLSVVVQGIGVVKNFIKSDFSRLDVSGRPAATVIDGTEDILKQLTTALKEADNVYVQDLLRYELIPQVDAIKELISALKATIDKRLA